MPSLRNLDLGKVLIKLRRRPKTEINNQFAYDMEQHQKELENQAGSNR